jgi:hypothetical protein
MEFTDRNVVTGLEGCGKSRETFKRVEKVATEERPLLVVVNNYELMKEQIRNWSGKYKIKEKEFAICGFNRRYAPAMRAYTNKEDSTKIEKGVRIVFCTQAMAQKNMHLELYNETTREKARYSHILVDEFSYDKGVVPPIDYQINNVRVNEKEINEKILAWVRENYTIQDCLKMLEKQKKKDKGFYLAHWIEGSEHPITFLTSERLAVELLGLVGFKKIEIESPDYSNQVIKTWSTPYIGREFFYQMRKQKGWETVSKELEYDVIISDCVNKYYTEEEIDIKVITHTGVRGSNNWINKKILTILSHVPSKHITEIKDAFEYFGKTTSYTEIESLFYRDRLCQAVGRVLGNRGSEETDLLINSKLYEQLENRKDLPYKLELGLEFSFSNFDQIRVAIEKQKNNIRTNKEAGINILSTIFERKEGAYISCDKLKDILKTNKIYTDQKSTLPATTVAEYFDSTIKRKSIDGKRTRVVLNIQPRQTTKMETL